MTFMTMKRLRSILSEDNKPVDEGGSKELLKKFPKGLKRLGVDASKIDSYPTLGTGTRGTAFDIGNDRVLKVTNDEHEAHAASVLVGKDIKNIVRFYAVVHFGDSPYYGILQEKLDPLPAASQKEFNDALVATALPIWIKRANGSWDEAKKLTKEYIVSQVKKKFSDNMNSPQAQEFARNINGKWNELVNKFGLRDIFNTLTELGIDFHDYHAGNMMVRRGGTLVLIDLGMSKIKGSAKIDTLTESVHLCLTCYLRCTGAVWLGARESRQWNSRT